MTDPLVALLPGVVALVALGTGARVWLAATRSLRSGTTYERLPDGVLVSCWLAVVLFYLLASLSLFNTPAAVVAVLLAGLAVLGARAAGRLRASESAEQLEPALETALARPNIRDPWLWAAVPVVGLALLRLIKGMTAPPMTRDAMTMHLPKAAFWIQSGSLSLPDFPDAWTYYRWFPDAGEILFAWVMLPFRGDLLLGPFGFFVWLAILIAAARFARYLGADDRIAWLAGAAVATLPTVMVFMTANYVDNLVILFVLLAVTHTVLFARTRANRNAILGLGAAGLAIATKTSALLMVAPIIATVAILAWRRRRLDNSEYQNQGSQAPALLMMAVALLAPCVGYFHTWAKTGSPFYPFKAPLLSLPFHQGLADLFAGRVLLPEGSSGSLGEVIQRLFWSSPYGQGHMNFGLGGIFLAAAAIVGIARAVRKGGWGTALWVTLAGAIVSTPLVFTEANLALRTLWVGVLGRHLLPTFAPIALWAAHAPGRTARLALASSLVAGTVHQLQLGWSPAMVSPALGIGASLALGVGTLIVLRRLRRLRRLRWLGWLRQPRVRWALTAVVALLFLGAWSSLRSRARFEIYRETASGRGAFDAHPGHPAFAMGASLWPMLDTPEDKVIAVTVGKDHVGHNQFFYPLMGSRLQNRLVYVPVSNSGEDSELEPDARYEAADPERWLARLDAASVDLVVGLWQATPEPDWLAGPGSFEVAALTNLGVPWIGRRREPPSEPPR